MLKRLAVGLGALVLSLVGPVTGGIAQAAQPGVSQKVAVCDFLTSVNCLKPNSNGSINVSGTITASLGAFNPVGSASLAVTTTSARVAFPTADPTALIRNTGTADAWLVFGNSSAVATTTTGTLLPAGQAVAYNVGAATNVAAITASGSTSLAITTGTGLPALTGGGGGSGGGGAITAASGSYASGALSAGAIVDIGTGASPAANTVNARLGAINVTLGSPFQAGGSIGNTTFASTQSGTWNLTNISGTISLPTGAATSALQTTGNTSLVSLVATLGATTDTTCTSTHSMSGCAYATLQAINGSIPAGTNVIGHVIADSGSTTAVTALPALPAGSNTIGTALAAATTTGGATPGITAALTNTAVAIKASAGSLYKVRCYNPNASAVTVQIYNIASGSVTVGTSTPVDIITIGATASGGWAMSPVGEAFTTAISYAASTTPTGGTAPSTALSCAYAFN